MGKMRAYLPYMGMFTIWLNDYPMFKYAVLGLMGFFVLIAKDPQWKKKKLIDKWIDCFYFLTSHEWIYILIIKGTLIYNF